MDECETNLDETATTSKYDVVSFAYHYSLHTMF